MAKTIKMCDMPVSIAVEVFKRLNGGKVEVLTHGSGHSYRDAVLITDDEPKNLVYPEGWYYAKGCFRNKGTSTTGIYSEVEMFKSNNGPWSTTATYSTI